VLSPLLGGTLTLTASGGPVTWSITESGALIGKVTVAPSSGRLLAGRSTTVTLSAASGVTALAALGNSVGACVGCQLTVNPGGIKVTVVIAISGGSSSPPPGSGNPGTAAAAERPRGRLVN
jgi:hypothetical protein